jgi:hypothetical protein
MEGKNEGSKSYRGGFIMRRLLILLCILSLILYASGSGAQTASEQKKEQGSEQKILEEVGGVLLPRGKLSIEPSIEYDYFSRRTISISGFTLLNAIVIGTIAVSDVKRDFLQGALTARYGITSRFEAELMVPYVYTSLRQVVGPGTASTLEKRVGDTDIGDIQGALYYHLIREKGWIPDVILNFRAKSPTGRDPYHLSTESIGGNTFFKDLPTGNGHWGFQGGFTLVKRSDPVVFFGGLSYYWNVRKDVGGGFGTVDPGDSWEGSIGVAYALSEKFSISGIYLHRITTKTEQNGQPVIGSFVNYGIMTFTGSYVLSKAVYVNLSVGIGVTNDAPDVTVRLSFPITFNLF